MCYNMDSLSYIVLQQKRRQMRGIHRGGGPPSRVWAKNTEDECLLPNDHYKLVIHSQMRFFLSCASQTARGSDAIFVCSLLHSVDCHPHPPSEKSAQNIIKSKYGTGGEVEPLKCSHDRRLLAALMGFQCKKSRTFNLLSGRVGGGQQNQLR